MADGLILSWSVGITPYQLYRKTKKYTDKWGRGKLEETRKKMYMEEHNVVGQRNFWEKHILNTEMKGRTFTDLDGTTHPDCFLYFENLAKEQKALKRRLEAAKATERPEREESASGDDTESEEDGAPHTVARRPVSHTSPRVTPNPRPGKSLGGIRPESFRLDQSDEEDNDEELHEDEETVHKEDEKKEDEEEGEEEGEEENEEEDEEEGEEEGEEEEDEKKIHSDEEEDNEVEDDVEDIEVERADVDDSEDDQVQDETLNPVDKTWDVDVEHYASILSTTLDQSILTYNTGYALFASVVGCYLASVHPSEDHLNNNTYANIDIENPNLKSPFLHNHTTVLIYDKEELIILCKLHPHDTKDMDGTIRHYKSIRDNITQDPPKIKYTLEWTQKENSNGSWTLFSCNPGNDEKNKLHESNDSTLTPPYSCEFEKIVCRDARNAAAFMMSDMKMPGISNGCGYYNAQVEDMVDDVYYWTDHTIKKKYKCFRTSSNWVVAEFDSIGTYNELFVSVSPTGAVEIHPRNVLQWSTSRLIGVHIPKSYLNSKENVFLSRSCPLVTHKPRRTENGICTRNFTYDKNKQKCVYTLRKKQKMMYCEINTTPKYDEYPDISMYSHEKPIYFPDILFADKMQLIECKQELVIYLLSDNSITARLVWSEADFAFKSSTTQLKFKNHLWEMIGSTINLVSLHKQLCVVGVGFFLCHTGQQIPSHYCTHSRNVDAFKIDSCQFEKIHETQVFHVYTYGNILMQKEMVDAVSGNYNWISRGEQNITLSRKFTIIDLDYIHPIYSTFSLKRNIQNNGVKKMQASFVKEEEEIKEKKKIIQDKKDEDVAKEQKLQRDLDEMKKKLEEFLLRGNQDTTRDIQDRVLSAEASLLLFQSKNQDNEVQLQRALALQEEQLERRIALFHTTFLQEIDQRMSNMAAISQRHHANTHASIDPVANAEMNNLLAQLRQYVNTANEDSRAIGTIETDARQLIQNYQQLLMNAEAREQEHARDDGLNTQARNLLRTNMQDELQTFQRRMQEIEVQFQRVDALNADRIHTATLRQAEAVSLHTVQTTRETEARERERVEVQRHQQYMTRIQELEEVRDENIANLNTIQADLAAAIERLGVQEASNQGRDRTNGEARRIVTRLEEQMTELRSRQATDEEALAIITRENATTEQRLRIIHAEMVRLGTVAIETARLTREAETSATNAISASNLIRNEHAVHSEERRVLENRISRISDEFDSLRSITPRLQYEMSFVLGLLKDNKDDPSSLSAIQISIRHIESEMEAMRQTVATNSERQESVLRLSALVNQLTQDNRERTEASARLIRDVSEPTEERRRSMTSGQLHARVERVRTLARDVSDGRAMLANMAADIRRIDQTPSPRVDPVEIPPAADANSITAAANIRRIDQTPSPRVSPVEIPPAADANSITAATRGDILQRMFEIRTTETALQTAILRLPSDVGATPIFASIGQWRQNRVQEIMREVTLQIANYQGHLRRLDAAYTNTSPEERLFIDNRINPLRDDLLRLEGQVNIVRIQFTARVEAESTRVITADNERQTREETTRAAEQLQNTLLRRWEDTIENIRNSLQLQHRPENHASIMRDLHHITTGVTQQHLQRFRDAVNRIFERDTTQFNQQIQARIASLMQLMIHALDSNNTVNIDQTVTLTELERQFSIIMTEIFDMIASSSETDLPTTGTGKRNRHLSNITAQSHSFSSGASSNDWDDARSYVSSIPEEEEGDLTPKKKPANASPDASSPRDWNFLNGMVSSWTRRASPNVGAGDVMGAAGGRPAHPLPSTNQWILAEVRREYTAEELATFNRHVISRGLRDDPRYEVWLARRTQLEVLAAQALAAITRLEQESGQNYARIRRQSDWSQLEENRLRRAERAWQTNDIPLTDEAQLWLDFTQSVRTEDLSLPFNNARWMRKYNRWRNKKNGLLHSSSSSEFDPEEENFTSTSTRHPRAQSQPARGSANWMNATMRSREFKSIKEWNKDGSVNKSFTKNNTVKQIKEGLKNGNKPEGLSDEEWEYIKSKEKKKK